jgi:hypothetical protein
MTGFADCHDLGVRAGIVRQRHLVHSFGNELPILGDDCAKGATPPLYAFEREFDGSSHELIQANTPMSNIG